MHHTSNQHSLIVRGKRQWKRGSRKGGRVIALSTSRAGVKHVIDAAAESHVSPNTAPTDLDLWKRVEPAITEDIPS
jgi:hypothetical protein